MCYLITLGIGRMEIDWGKKNFVRDHYVLFKPTDYKEELTNYKNDDRCDDLTLIEENQYGYSRKLSTIKKRLDLLGYDINSIERIFNEEIHFFIDHGHELPLSFTDFYNVLLELDISEVDTVSIENEYGDFDPGEFASRCVMEESHIKSAFIKYLFNGKSECYHAFKWEISDFIENIDPYLVLRILAEKSDNEDLDVNWFCTDFLDNELQENPANNREITSFLPPEKQILIVTEGSSDTDILRKTIGDLYPEISDFFNFIDMSSNYPFTGVGELKKFCQGLCKINIQNNVIVIFDNDTAGKEKFNIIHAVHKPASLVIIKLPDYSEFSHILTSGPQGDTFEDINGRAVAIECFLDFTSVNHESYIRWTAYNRNVNQYQGELWNKDDYIKEFHKRCLTDGSYNTTKLRFLIDYIVESWIKRNISS